MAKRMTTEARRVQLLAAGKRVFATVAYDKVSTADLAAATDTSKGLLYHYFGNKRGFYLATIRASADELLAATTFAPELGGIAGSLDRFAQFVEREGAFFRSVVRGGIGADEEVDTLVRGVRSELVARICGALGVVEPSVTMTAQMWGWIGYAEGIAIFWVEEQTFDRATLASLLQASFLSILTTGMADAVETEKRQEG